MHRYSMFDNRLTERGAAGISALSGAALYGRGVFTTVAIRGGVPFLWEKHWRRLNADAAKLGIGLSAHPEPTVSDALAKLIDANEIISGRARITFFDESPTALWPFDAPKKTSILITTADVRKAFESVRVGVSPFAANTRSPLSGVKSCNYLEKVLALEEAKARGLEEAVVLNEDANLTSGCAANLFWSEGGKLFTPALSTGCLAGTTREFAIETFECAEGVCGIDVLRGADQIYLTSAGIGVTAVADFDGRKLARAYHPILDLIPHA